MNTYISADLFSGCGGLSAGMSEAGFDVKVAIENNEYAIKTFKKNHGDCEVISEDIRKISPEEVQEYLGDNILHLLAGCPPCQGFSSIRKLNKKRSRKDPRNALVDEYLRFVEGIKPLTIMMENVPGLESYYKFDDLIRGLKKLDYKLDYRVVNVKNYGVPQSRRRLVLVGSLLGDIEVAEETGEAKTVRETFDEIESFEETTDPLHKITVNHTKRIQKLISEVPHNGGSLSDVDPEYLSCHQKENVGFNDVYGRLRWDDYSTTITGGCLNPSKGRFLHPEEDRVITPREASLLQTFPKDYKFSTDMPKNALASMIGNALPPKFSYIQSNNIKEHLNQQLQ
ncbi:DNA cytosine methyltransferase [Fodinibius halophilus]|uniref:DNA (cytosine-5-)-methyltransferase n=1 Tax=Fodinibius halophilus TaxID=1736908 RepID=A0A6M1T534_9BACT|nr:DNA cytosine methyltransferase [Fodinibius halophilus]NGP89189.1 DNA cytosine methyltransferase [Fodinibius halophilus]